MDLWKITKLGLTVILYIVSFLQSSLVFVNIHILSEVALILHVTSLAFFTFNVVHINLVICFGLFVALNSLVCTDVLLRNYLLTL